MEGRTEQQTLPKLSLNEILGRKAENVEGLACPGLRCFPGRMTLSAQTGKVPNRSGQLAQQGLPFYILSNHVQPPYLPRVPRSSQPSREEECRYTAPSPVIH